MTDQWNSGSGAAGPQSPTSDRPRNERWLRRPRRSTGDRKIAGVAGGLGRAFGIDPILIRVAFVVLTIFGGFGGLLYVLGWLFLPSDGDEVSAAEALLGRGRSSVPPPLAVGLGVIAVISAFWMFSWGRPFLPLAIGGVIVLAVMRRRGHFHGWSGPGRDWSGPRTADWARRTDEQVRAWSEQAEQWADTFRGNARSAARAGRGCGRGWGQWNPWGAASSDNPADSPFQRPAFWDAPDSSTRVDRPAPRSQTPGTQTAGAQTPDAQTPGAQTPGTQTSGVQTSGVNMTKPSTTPADPARDDPMNLGTPPAWDPLGVAPFAWDLPEPTPLAPAPAPAHRSGGVIARVTMGATLLIGGLTAAGVFAGWWVLTWAQVAGISLGVLGLGLLISALRGRGYSLIGPGVFLSLVTLALAVTGVSGTTGYGQTDLRPTAIAQLQDSYVAQAGEFNLDLSALPTIPKGAERTVTIQVKAGHADVTVPTTMNVTATCETKVGEAQCLGYSIRGVNQQTTVRQSPSADAGRLNVIVKVNAGFAEVKTDA
ncbi:PspC domain-containing protein [Nakamurella panacisegetis]|nr:PspC domain-containing protein [Nakamurella panacisegetis]